MSELGLSLCVFWRSQFKQVYQESSFTAVSAKRRNGLILCKAYHAEFAGPGAAVGRPCDYDCQSAIALGRKLSLVTVTPGEEEQDAYRRRIQWMYWLKKITEQPPPRQRAEALLSSFDAFFEPAAIASLPPQVLAQLVGVFPCTMVEVHRQHYAALGVDIPDQFAPNDHWHYVELPQLSPPPESELPQPEISPPQGLSQRPSRSMMMF